jgi:hypothetical protein
MKIMIFLILLIVGYIAFFKDDDNHVKHTAEISNSAAIDDVVQEAIDDVVQDNILNSLLSMKDRSVSQFVNDWKDYAPEPTPEQLSELKKIAYNIDIDKNNAVKYTKNWHEEHDLCGKAEALHGKVGCNPGL